MPLDKETKAGLNRMDDEINELNDMRLKLHEAIKAVSKDATIVAPALMVLLSDYVGYSNNTTDIS